VLQPTDVLRISLTAAAWNTVLQVLATGSYQVVAPLIQDIQNQCMAEEQGLDASAGVVNGSGATNGHARPALVPVPEDQPA